MSSLAEKYEWLRTTRYLGPARVLEVDETGDLVNLCLTGSGECGNVWARVAIPSIHQLAPGVTVLVVGEDMDDMYVIGLLTRKNASVISSERLDLSSGAYAEVAGPSGAERLQVFSKERELLFEYDEEKGRALVNVDSGDLEFVTQKGNISFRSAQGIHFHGQSIGMTSRWGIRLGIMDAIGKIRSAVTLQPRRMNLSSPEVGIAAQRGEFQIEETEYTGEKLLVKIGFAKLMIQRLETIAKSINLKAKNIYKRVEQLSQLKTGRMRTLVDSTFHFKSRKAFLKSEEDFKVKADRIHLG